MIANSIIRNLALIAVLILLILPTTAQDESDNTQRFLEMLALMPDTEELRQELYYADVRTAIETRPGTPQFNSMDEWYDADEEQRDWWIYGLPQTFLIMEYFRHMLADGGESTGIDIFTVEQLLAFGQPPAQAMILQGDFDNAAITDAYTSNGWEVVSNENDITLMCSIEGCEKGLEVNLENVGRENPFGGRLGRIEPIALADGFIFNSADIAVLEEILQVQSENTPSLADAPDIQTAVQVIAEQGLIRQTVIVAPEMVVSNPAFDFVMIADTANLETETQTGSIVMVYEDNEQAQNTLTAIEANLQPDGVRSERMQRPLREILDERGELQMQVVEANGYSVLVVSLQAPIVMFHDTDDINRPMQSGMQFYLFLQMIFQRDTGWLNPVQ